MELSVKQEQLTENFKLGFNTNWEKQCCTPRSYVNPKSGIHGIAGIRNAWQSKKKCSPIKVKLKTGVSPARVKQFPLRIQDCRRIKEIINNFLNFGLSLG